MAGKASCDFGRHGGVERTAWYTLLEMDRFDHRAGELDQGAITLVFGLAETFERVSRPLVWAWATENFVGAWWLLRAPTAGSV